jgi:hypothetical protein
LFFTKIVRDIQAMFIACGSFPILWPLEGETIDDQTPKKYLYLGRIPNQMVGFLGSPLCEK